MKKVIFIDFDGTITKKDTCSAMIAAFAKDGWEKINKLWEDKKISTEECAHRIFQLFDANIDDLKDLLDTIEIDDYFLEFIKICHDRRYNLYILSDGYDFNIEIIFKKYHINEKYYANKLLYQNDRGFKIQSPYRNSLCKSCGTCKTGLIDKLKEDGDEVIYIGDGYSDICPAMNADVVFAKDVLYKICKESGINAIFFSSFMDIITSGVL